MFSRQTSSENDYQIQSIIHQTKVKDFLGNFFSQTI